MWQLLLFCLLTAINVQAAEAYKCKGKNGETIFSDQPCAKNAETIELKEPQTFSAPLPTTATTPAPNEKNKEKVVYTEFSFLSPTSGQIFDDGTGNVRAALSIKPRLSTGHTVQFFLNNTVQGEPARRSEWSFSNLDRGDYQLRAELLDERGRVLQSASGNFAVVKHLPKKP